MFSGPFRARRRGQQLERILRVFKRGLQCWPLSLSMVGALLLVGGAVRLGPYLQVAHVRQQVGQVEELLARGEIEVGLVSGDADRARSQRRQLAAEQRLHRRRRSCERLLRRVVMGGERRLLIGEARRRDDHVQLDVGHGF